MKKVIKFMQVIRNNWKKSAFATCLVSYGVNYGKNAYDTRQLMRSYCEEAAKYGEQPIPLSQPLRRITVVLNPAANKKKCKDLFEKYCAPLFHLAGVLVTVVLTEYAGQAKDLPEALDPLTDAIVIAGGDGTLNETVTGLMRRAEGNVKALQNLPIGVLPLGRTSSFARAIVGDVKEVKALAEATMAVIDGALRPVDVLKIQPIEDEGRPVYSVARVEWGAHRDVTARRDKFWLFGPLREHVSYLMAGFPVKADWICEYSEPCIGCLKCHTPETNVNKRWWHSFVPRATPAAHLLVANERCGVMKETAVSTVYFTVETETVQSDFITASQTPHAHHMDMKIGPEYMGMFQFIRQGWTKLKGAAPEPDQIMQVQNLKLVPKGEKEEEEWFSIDSEDFEVKPVMLSLLPKTLRIFEPRRDRQV